MKTIKIRFVEREKNFLIQRKTWFGWRYFKFIEHLGYGAIIYYYGKETKEELLSDELFKESLLSSLSRNA